MELNRRRVMTAYLAGVLATGPLYVVLDEAGPDVRLAVGIAAMALFVASHVRVAVFALREGARAARTPDAEPDEEAQRRRVRSLVPHLVALLGFPLVMLAAHPWGMATIAVAGGVFVGCGLLLTQTMVFGGLLMHRRMRRRGELPPRPTRRPRPARPAPPGGPPW